MCRSPDILRRSCAGLASTTSTTLVVKMLGIYRPHNHAAGGWTPLVVLGPKTIFHALSHSTDNVDLVVWLKQNVSLVLSLTQHISWGVSVSKMFLGVSQSREGGRYTYTRPSGALL